MNTSSKTAAEIVLGFAKDPTAAKMAERILSPMVANTSRTSILMPPDQQGTVEPGSSIEIPQEMTVAPDQPRPGNTPQEPSTVVPAPSVTATTTAEQFGI